LIAGGKQAADANFTPLIELVKKRVKTLILVGESKEQINRDIGDFSETFLVGTFEEAILLSYQKSREGDVILLSPGCESYDMFHSYEERGRYFTKYLDEI
jgi:UDP-N-acetylmuramoylalanine--D-glutamate ligase